ncbi:phosphate signaling complex protein PhoU [Xylocopilactobacillus apicola]|uniref:Phosphate-specific transport system accessory protein PhoU n=1 Tax=Xylocopilactobacillus apicola TaxID=2932184 RepID=A0AAU9CVE3_9LACO|nr:phosphate signaling complex protein PhoU [Xylocopilactobacillus apicola]BDR57952.1 phosphate transport system regulatory protein PhoU [Xylocopilactobacillus apicola]
MRQTFDQELEKLNESFTYMGKLVSKQVENGIGAYLNQDAELANEVVKNDQAVNDEQMKLEKKSLELIALQQPVTADLRLIVTVLKASADLERMGDHAVSVAKYFLRQQKISRVVPIEQLVAEMGMGVRKMLEDVLLAFTKEDQAKAIEIARSDKKINEDSLQIYKMCIKCMKEKPEGIESDTNYMMVANTIERIGDYVTNICEWIVYLVEGKLVDLDTDNMS